ncbi:sh3 domain signaling protein [Paraphaeosphaeria sporulosa]
MQRMQRKFGRLPFMARTPNEADIEAMLRDFNDSDQMLKNIEEASAQWRDAWTNILNHQLSCAEGLHSIYKPVAGEFTRHEHADTPAETMERAVKLEEAFAELKTDMMEEIKDIDKKLILPAKIARDSLKPMKKAITKREDRKVDYERYKGRAEALQKKKTRSDRENTALAKHEADLERAIHEYNYADEGLRTQLPKLNAATFSLLPHLLANQIILQNNLIGNLYTVLHQYSHEQGYPDPPPEPEEVIPEWDASFTSMRKEMEENFELLRTGKARTQPMRLPDKGDTITGIGIRNKVLPGRRTSSSETIPIRDRSPRPQRHNLPPTNEDDGPPAPKLNLASKPSMNQLNASKPRIGGASPGLIPTPTFDQFGRRTSSYSDASSTHTNGHDDYFGNSNGNGRPRIPSTSSSYGAGYPSPQALAAKKKPPPPPPPKKVGSFHGEYVTAMYDFEGQSEGDLSFREGDKIRVIKKTNSSQDWWEGELRGYKGSFPANYVKE